MQHILILLVLCCLRCSALTTTPTEPSKGVIRLPIQRNPAPPSQTLGSGHRKVQSKLALIGVEFLDETDAYDPEASHKRDDATPPPTASPGKQIIVGLDNHQDFIYHVDFTLGTPPQPFKSILDTGSNELWIGSQTCQSKSQCKNLHTFNPEKSTTFKDISQNRTVLSNITYGKGFVEGYHATDVLSLAGTKINEQQFLLVEKQDTAFLKQINGTSDGIMGLAYVGGLKGLQNVTASKNAEVETVVMALVKKGVLAQPLFSLYLAKAGDKGDMKGNGGELVLGGIDATKFYGNVTYHAVSPVAKNYYWTVQVNGFSFGGGSVDGAVSNLYAIVDSGSSFIAMDAVSFKSQLLPALQKGGASVTFDPPTNLTQINCADLGKLPALSFTLGNATTDSVNVYTLNPSDYIVKKTIQGTTFCLLGIMPNGFKAKSDGSVIWILGDVFLRRYYTVFDYSNGGRLGFATAYQTSGAMTAGTFGFAILISIVFVAL
ncbi:aspartic peptidase domain-containing protein [Obelidium mucronatum]|nr:aspartic peptidase domain-containing protein [Obelidium mucronatum]